MFIVLHASHQGAESSKICPWCSLWTPSNSRWSEHSDIQWTTAVASVAISNLTPISFLRAQVQQLCKGTVIKLPVCFSEDVEKS